MSVSRKVTILTSFSTKVAKLLTLNDRIIAIETTIRVIVIQDIEANEREKFLNTLLNESIILRDKILNPFIFICSFLIIFYHSTSVQ